MTQAYNLSQLANNLDSSGRLDATDGLVNALPVANGGTGASTAAAGRTNLNVPTRTGGDASGTWAISISGNANTASSASSASVASSPASGGSFITSLNIGGQSVAYASSAGTAASVSSIADAQICKAWARINASGNLVAGYNISSTGGTDPCTINLATALADANFAPVISGQGAGGSTRYACIDGIASSSQFTVRNGFALTGITGVAVFR
jgi:hypothetical protein